MLADYKVNIDEVNFDSDKGTVDYYVSLNGVQLDNPLRITLNSEDLETLETTLALIFEENKASAQIYSGEEDA